ncbi:hypothetical protein BMF35_a0210 [Aurantiacibacter gangjinensis]|nr:hypothetical protein BMF35_a0210 [Aurantiacibacter gangjinensis]
MLVWAICGGGGYLIGSYLARNGFELWPSVGTDVVIALGVALIYLLLGLFLLGARLSPAFRRSTMSELDAADVEDQKPLFSLQSVAVILWAIALAALALAGHGAPLSSTAGAAMFLGAMVLGGVLYWRSLPMLDELMRATTLESAAITYGLVLAIGGGWMALGHLDLVADPTMLVLVTMFWVLALVGTVVAVARRGMLEDD